MLKRLRRMRTRVKECMAKKMGATDRKVEKGEFWQGTGVLGMGMCGAGGDAKRR